MKTKEVFCSILMLAEEFCESIGVIFLKVLVSRLGNPLPITEIKLLRGRIMQAYLKVGIILYVDNKYIRMIFTCTQASL